MKLAACLNKFPQDLPLVVSNSTTLRVSDFVNNSELPSGNSILIATGDIVESLKLMVALDGTASRLGFCSSSLSVDEIEKIVIAGGFTCILGDKSDTTLRFSTAEEAISHLVSESNRIQTSPTTWVMTTSGTTGIPKLVSHTLGSLTATTKISEEPSAGVRWGLLYDFTRFAGMQVVLQSIMSGSVLVVASNISSLGKNLDFFSENGVTHISATPTMWRKILMTPEHSKLQIKTATLGGEIADRQILEAIKNTFPKAQIIQIYASTEAGVGFSVKDGEVGFPAEYLTNPNIGSQMRITNDVLEIKNLDIGKSYLGTDERIADSDSWISTGDLVERKGNRIVFLGRQNGTINIGGNKVLPEKIEAALLKHPAVQSAVAYGRRNPISGALVAATIVLKDTMEDTKLVKKILRVHLENELLPHEIPATFKFVEKLETNASGKIKRNLK